MNILLTGASGYIGKALLPALLKERHSITNLCRVPGEVHGIDEEIVAPTRQWPDTVRGRYFDICIHLAWIATPGIYAFSTENEILADTTVRLADSLFTSGLPHFLGLGTSIEYAPGQSTPCRPGETPLAPETLYGRAKDRARRGIEDCAVRHNSGYTWARLFYPYGAGEHPNRIPSTFLQTLSQGEAIELGTPDSRKDFITIRDVVSALLCIVRTGTPLGEINIGSGQATSIAELAALCAEVAGASPALITTAKTRNADPYAFHLADISALSRLGWKPRVDVREGLSGLYNSLTSKG